MHKLIISFAILAFYYIAMLGKVNAEIAASAPSSGNESARFMPGGSHGYPAFGGPGYYGDPGFGGPGYYGDPYLQTFNPMGPSYGYPAFNNPWWQQVPTDSVQAQGARALAMASNNVGVLQTISQNNNDLFYGPQRVMAVEASVDHVMNRMYGGYGGYGGHGGYGGGYDYYGGSYGGGYNRAGSPFAAHSASNELQRQLSQYLNGNSYLGTSAQVYDETWRTHAQFTGALSNTAAQQRAAHELAYASAAMPFMY